MPRYIGYCRVSTDQQEESGLSLLAQNTAINQYCQLYNLDLETIIVDSGSGKNLNRPGLQSCLKMLQNEEAMGLIITKLDRLSRSIIDFNYLIESVFSNRELISIENHIDTRSASGRLCLNILMTVAQWEREAISERTRTALNQKRENGQRLGRPPYGFSLVNGQLIPKTSEQEIITKIRRFKGYGWSLGKIASKLDELEIPPPSGEFWSRATINNIIRRR